MMERFRPSLLTMEPQFHDYKGIEERTKVMFYFARPYHSWERGSNENANGLIRQYLPKGMSMAAVSQQLCNAMARKLKHQTAQATRI